MQLLPLLTLASALVANANPLPVADGVRLVERAAPTVTIASGTVIGSTDGTVDSFRGIPFAQPPVGNLRLRPPQPITRNLGTINAVGVARSCPQPSILQALNASAIPPDVLASIQGNPFFQDVTNQGEDCLNLNVQKPRNATSSSKLPVLVWIYGGGFEFGSTQTYDGTSIINRSIALGEPILFVEMNYRVGGFGFLAGKELQDDGATNLGLRDQRLALQWVQDNIAAFGGDPTKVTIWGESAGSISVFDHTVINGGDNRYKNGKLFRGAIMDSGSVVPADTVSGISAQTIYNTVVAAAGCSSARNTLTCLRNLDYGKFLVATNSVPSIFSYRSVDLSYVPRPDPKNNFFAVSPEVSIGKGMFTKVPIIIGDQEDEGTLFSLVQSNISTTDQLVTYFTSFFPSVPNARSIVQGLVNTYPDDPAAGSPFGTGPLYNLYPQFKRLAALLGDATFTLTRRGYLSTVASQVPAWSYLSTYFYGTPVLGTFHATDIVYAFGLLGPAPVPTVSIQQYYISFVNHLNPNTIGTAAPLINWPNWTSAGRSLLNFQALSNKIIPDTFREASFQYLNTAGAALRV